MAEVVPGGIDRRRVLAGIAWTTPAIVLAVSVPQAAASGEPAGALVVLDANGNVTNVALTVHANVTYTNDESPGAPVTSITATIVIPNAQVNPTVDPVPAGVSWDYVGPPEIGAEHTTFHFSYDGPDLSQSLPVASLSVQFARSGDVAVPFDVTVLADGFSNDLAVPQASGVATIGVGATIVNNVTPPYQAQDMYLGVAPANAFYGTTRWAGPYNPSGVPVTGIRCVARMPEANSNGQLIQGVLGAGWALVHLPVVEEGYWRVEYRYSGTLDSINQNTTELQFGLGRIVPAGAGNEVTMRVEGMAQTGPSSTSPVFWQASSTAVTTAIPTYTPYPTDYVGPPPPEDPFVPVVGAPVPPEPLEP